MREYNFELIAAGIDTLEVQSPTFADTYPFFTHDATRRMTTEEGTEKYKYRVNPDKTLIDTSTFDGYQKAMDYIYRVSALVNPVKTRIDFRFDFYGEDYERTSKTNKLLLLLIAEKYHIKNRYQCIDMLTTEKKTLCVKNKHIEVEAYNKAIQEPESCIPCRLEIRSKALYYDEEEETKELRELHNWFTRIASATTAENLNILTGELNKHILARYTKEKPTISSKKFDMAFLYKYEDFIFTSKQMKELFTAMGYTRPDKRLCEYRSTFGGAEFFSLKNIRDYALTIRKSAEAFLTGGEQNQNTQKLG